MLLEIAFINYQSINENNLKLFFISKFLIIFTKKVMKIKIEYSNNFTQVKQVISQHIFDTIVKPNQISKYELEVQLKDKATSNNKKQILLQELKIIKQNLEQFNFPFVTDESPIYNALNTDLLVLPEHQGGTHKIKITML